MKQQCSERLVRSNCVFLLAVLFAITMICNTVDYAGAQFRGGGPGGGPDRWVITYSCSGSGSAYRINFDKTREGITLNWNGSNSSTGEMAAHYKLGGTHTGGANASGTITATLTWLAADGVSPAKTKPLAKIYLMESTSAIFDYGYGDATSSSVSASVDDGMNDPQVESGGLTYSSSGKHLVQADGSSGVITRTVSMSATGSITDTQGLGNEYVASCDLTVTLDTRGAEIYCSALEDGGNYQKGANNIPVLNVRNADGSMTVDTVMQDEAFDKKGWRLWAALEAYTVGFDVTTTDLFSNIVNTSCDWKGQARWGVTFGDSDGLTTSALDLGDVPLMDTMNISLKVTDLRPNSSATADNTYTIHIHGANENNVQIAHAFDHYDSYPWTSQIPANASTAIKMVAGEARPWTFLGANGTQITGSMLSGLLGSGSAALFFPEDAIALMTVDMAFNAIGWLVTQSGTPDATTDKNVTANRDAYDKAIKQQGLIDSYGVNNPALKDYVDCPTDTRIKGVSTAKVTADPNKYWGFGIPRGRCHGGTRNVKFTEHADGYDIHGYIGQVTVYPIIFDRYIDDVWEWTVNAVP